MQVIPSPEVRLSVYIFSVENPATFLDGTDEKLRLIEIGPIVYREYLHHQNIEHHENSTLSYTAARRVEFLVDQNEPGILERYILVPNFVLLVSTILIYVINSTFFLGELKTCFKKKYTEKSWHLTKDSILCLHFK